MVQLDTQGRYIGKTRAIMFGKHWSYIIIGYVLYALCFREPM